MPAGYSGTLLAKKLGIGPGGRVALLAAPAGFEGQLEGLPPDARIGRRLGEQHDVIVLFLKRAAELARLQECARALEPSGGLWIAWPKQSSGVATDVDFDRVQKAGLALGLVDNKVCAIDETWSGLRFVVRLADRPKRPASAKQSASPKRSASPKPR
jgi:hypothetical protein